MIPYILHVSILLAGCYVFYWLLLREETFFKLNRGVLLACLILPLVLPLITIPASWSLGIFQNSIVKQTDFTYHTHIDDTTIEQDEMNSFEPVSGEQVSPELEGSNAIADGVPLTLSEALNYFYWAGVAIFAVVFLIQLFLILAKIASLPSYLDGKYRVVELVKDEAPFSFWNVIFINPAKYDLDTYNQILEHEKIHIDQTHFFDKILVEMMVIIFWFNPFVWFFRKVITNNLEYLTDQSMLLKGFPKQAYQLSLLKVSVTRQPLNLTTNYNQSFLKSRISMMNSKKSSVRSMWKYLFILPLLGLSILSLNAVDASNNEITSREELIDNNIVTNETMKIKEPNNNVPTENPNESTSEHQENTRVYDQTQKGKLKEELISNLKKDNLILNEDLEITFKIFEDKILVNEKELSSKLRKKYLAIFKKYSLETDESMMLVMRPIVIMTGEYINSNSLGTTITQSPRPLTGNVNVHSTDGVTYIQGSGTHTVNGTTVQGIASEPIAIAENGLTYTVNRGEPIIAGSATAIPSNNLTTAQGYNGSITTTTSIGSTINSKEKRYLEQSKGNGHLDWVGYGNTKLPASSTVSTWQIPEFCQKVRARLIAQNIIHNDEKFILVFGAQKVYVNGRILSGEIYKTLTDLAMSHQIRIFRGWNLEMDGKSIIIVDNVNNVDRLREELVDLLLKDGFMKNGKEEIAMEIAGNEILINGKAMPKSKMKKYNDLIDDYRIVPSPGKEIVLNRKRKNSIGVGYMRDKTLLGTFSM